MKIIEESNVPFEAVERKLNKDDDRGLWQTALTVLTDEFLQRFDQETKNRDWVFVVGACSQWVRPHNSHWNAAGGFVYPEGYKDSSPELDWSVILAVQDQSWVTVKKLPGKRQIIFRVAIPTRTARHKQAAVHTRWSPGAETVLYGFRNVNGHWRCVAASDEKLRGHISVMPQTQK
jgi:hypothetical protein